MTDAEIFERIDFSRGFIFSCQTGSDEDCKSYSFRPVAPCVSLLQAVLHEEMLSRQRCERVEESGTEIIVRMNGEQAFFVGAALCGVNFNFEYDDQKYYIALFDTLWKADRTGGSFAMHFAVSKVSHPVLDSPGFSPVLITGRS